ncbi:hypothetical protein RJ639_012442 [Escallonia herrerae]|uniref:DC1 domain-containing protein n=1 Tax=Escallonia herrerae TaxID=1293975 RepID=A0AA88VL25_9ASTE|nr:hypothetical protein RJ639_012442 [Escallonia herrerae]
MELHCHHFSHQHPLVCTKSPPKENTTCSGCKISMLPGKYYYKCKTCPYFLHRVCYDMPKKVQHPVDPDHDLILQAVLQTQSTKVSIECKACGHQVTGFYYSCLICGDYYHTLCSAAPLSVRTPSHHHKLLLEYSLPYEFQCDLCKLSSYNGWLYHCGSCEFDAHVSCAIANKGAQLLQPPEIDRTMDSSIKRHELMELLSRGMKGVEDSINRESFQGQHVLPDQSTPLSSAFPSYQSSDACFSIDFQKSPLEKDDQVATQVSEGDSTYDQMNAVEGKQITCHVNTTSVNGSMVVNPSHARQESENWKSLGSEVKLNKSFSTGIGSHTWVELDPENKKREANGPKLKLEALDQSTRSDTVNLGCSSWPKLLISIFYLRNDRGIKRSKKGKKAS